MPSNPRRPRLAPLPALALLALLAAASLSAQEAASSGDAPAWAATAAELRDRALSEEERDTPWEILESLTTEVGPRFAGSPGDKAAIAWGLRTMEALGFEAVRAEPVTVPHWVRGRNEGEILAPFPQPMVLTALGGSVATPGDGLVAEVVRAGSLAELAALPDEAVAGKIVFLDQSMERRRDGAGYGQTVGIRSIGPVEAAKKGAVGLVIRSVGTGTHRFPHTGGTRYDEAVPKIPAAALAIPDADLLAAQLERVQQDGADPEPGQRLGPVRFRLVLDTETLPDEPSANVIGEVRGRELPDEIVLIACHLDSWDLGTGAIDDGAGCAHVLTAGALLARLPEAPRRTVRVVLFANEEFGLSGARAYAEAHADALDRHVLAAESDFGAGRIWRFALLADPAALPDAEALAEVLAPLGIEWDGNSARGGADLIPLRSARVPLADLTPDGTHYFDYHHTADDTLDKVDPDLLAQASAAWAALAWWAAETDADLGRAPEPYGNE